MLLALGGSPRNLDVRSGICHNERVDTKFSNAEPFTTTTIAAASAASAASGQRRW